MRTFLIILAIVTVMICVIIIPAVEEAEYARTHPGFLNNAYDLRNAQLGNQPDTVKKREN